MLSNGKCRRWRWWRDIRAGEQVRARNQGHIVSRDAVVCPLTSGKHGPIPGWRPGDNGPMPPSNAPHRCCSGSAASWPHGPAIFRPGSRIPMPPPGGANPPSPSPMPSPPCGANCGWMDDSNAPRQTGSGTRPGRPILSIMPGARQQPDTAGSKCLRRGSGAWLKRCATRHNRAKSSLAPEACCHAAPGRG